MFNELENQIWMFRVRNNRAFKDDYFKVSIKFTEDSSRILKSQAPFYEFSYKDIMSMEVESREGVMHLYMKLSNGNSLTFVPPHSSTFTYTTINQLTKALADAFDKCKRGLFESGNQQQTVGNATFGDSSVNEAPAGPPKLCKACGAENRATSKFCSKCGAIMATDLFCPQCGVSNPPHAKFCQTCGTNLIK